MKKVAILLIMLVSFTATVSAQVKQPDNFKPYVGGGITVSGGENYFGGELGLYNSKAWYAVGISTLEGSGDYTTSFKAYYKVANQSIVDVFGFGAVNYSLDGNKTLSLEPGAAVVFNLGKTFAPQVSLSTTVYDNDGFRFRGGLNAGLSLNIWLK